MTVQILDNISLSGFQYRLADFPLERYWELRGMHSPFPSLHSANWRGYEANWSISNGRLFLKSIMYYSQETEKWVEALDQIFPDSTGSVWAHWYSGQIRFGLYPKTGNPPRKYEVSFQLENKVKLKDGSVVSEDLFYKVAG